MNNLELIIANKKYSSWSMRPWLAMKVFDIAFTETLIRFDHTPENQLEWNAHFLDYSPAGKVPVLKHHGFSVWDSLAILEYLAETFPGKNWWPQDPQARAHARAISCEMHSGFFALRDECPMNFARPQRAIEVSPAALKDIARIEQIWQTCIGASGGPFLFGDFSIPDAMFAPVINRFERYRLSGSKIAAQYAKAITSLPAWRDWAAAGAAEPWICEIAEV